MLLEKYDYTISYVYPQDQFSNPSIKYELTIFEKEDTARKVVFYGYTNLNGMIDSSTGIERHAESLTDANCEQWLPKAKKAK